MRKLFLLAGLVFWVPSYAQSAPTASLTFDFLPSDVTLYGVTGFEIQRKAEACAGALAFTALTTTAPTARGYVDATVVVGKTYCFRARALAPVTATNLQGNSGFSNVAEKTIPLPTIPVPQNLILNLVNAMIDALEQFKTALGQPQ